MIPMYIFISVMGRIFKMYDINFPTFVITQLKCIQPSRHMKSKSRCTDVDATSSRPIDVNTTSFQRCVPAGNVQCRK